EEERTRTILGAQRYKPSIVILSYHNLVWFTKVFGSVVNSRFEAVVFDELSRMKSPGAKWFKAARTWLREIPIRIGLTGTPVGNHLRDVWGEMHMVDQTCPLENTFTLFERTYFKPRRVTAQIIKWDIPLPDAQKRISECMKPFAFSIQ